MFGINNGEQVLVIWSNPINTEELHTFVEDLKSAVGTGGRIYVENSEMLVMSGHTQSYFDHVLTGPLPPFTYQPTVGILGEALRILKPNGRLTARTVSPAALQTTLKLAGFVNVSPGTIANLTDEQKRELTGPVSEIRGYRPQFEVGSSVKLSLGASKASEASQKVGASEASKTANSGGSNKTSTAGNGGGLGASEASKASKTSSNGSPWTVDLSDDLSGDLASPDDLLSAEDVAAPDPSSLKVCGTTGQRKACKNCVCGLREELEEEEKVPQKSNSDFKSSCGSCYLGDAFRCASCPYLGMPAFKPGEKVKLNLN